MNRQGVALLLAPFLVGGCTHKALEDVETTAAATVTVLRLEPQTVRSVVTAAGTVAAAPGADWTITAPEAARIVEMPKAEGDPVKTGYFLVRFEIPSLTTDLATRRAEGQQAQARVDNAQASMTRLTTLVQDGVAAQKELEDARRELAEATAALEQSRSALQSASMLESRTIVRARFPGIVAKRAHNPGDMVEASATDVILRVVDPTKLQVLAAVAIADVQRVAVGKPVRILVAGADESEPGKVLTRPAAVDAGGLSRSGPHRLCPADAVAGRNAGQRRDRRRRTSWRTRGSGGSRSARTGPGLRDGRQHGQQGTAAHGDARVDDADHRRGHQRSEGRRPSDRARAGGPS